MIKHAKSRLTAILTSLAMVFTNTASFAGSATDSNRLAPPGTATTPVEAAQAMAGPIPAAYVPFSEPQTYEQAKATIQDAEKRPVGRFTSALEQSEFVVLIHANALTQFVNDPDAFIKWWNANQTGLIQKIVDMEPNVSWQGFLTHIYIKYQIEITDASKNPNAFIQWLQSVVSNPWVRWGSAVTVGILGATGSFLLGLASGVVAAGPLSKFANAYLDPIIGPLSQWFTIRGVKDGGTLGKKLSEKLFTDAKNAKEDLGSLKNSIEAIRELINSTQFEISPARLAEAINRYKVTGIHLQYTFTKMPEVVREGRNRFVENVLGRPRDFGVNVATSMGTSEVYRSTAERILNEISAANASNAAEVRRVGYNLFDALAVSAREDRIPSARPSETKAKVEGLKAELIGLGADANQVARVHEGFLKFFVFNRQAAGVVANRLLEFTLYSDIIVEASEPFKTMLDYMGNDFFRREFASEISEISKEMGLKIDLSIASMDALLAKSNAEAVVESERENTRAETLRIVGKTVKTQIGQRVLESEPGGVGRKKDPNSAKESLRESAREAGRVRGL